MAKGKRTPTLSEAVSSELKANFSLERFKEKKMLNSNVQFKEQQWIPFSRALENALSIPGIPTGQVVMVRGGSDTGKTSLLLEVATTAQKMGILPVFIITEMKWDFSHAKKMGFELIEKPDPENPDHIDYSGFFLYVDRSTLNTIEDVAGFIADILDEQKKGNLPYDLLFLWDSVGSIPSQLSIEANKNNPQWNAGAMATQFGNFINQKFPLSRKTTSPYTNTLFVINKTGVQPAETPMSQPRMTNKGGNTMYWDAALVITFGNVTNSGTSKIKAVKDKKNVEFAKRTKIAIDKIHLKDGIATRSTVIITPHGFIDDTDKAINEYKKLYSTEWFSGNVDKDDIQIIEDSSEWDEKQQISDLLIDDETNGTI
jgi:hypothetical protein